MSSLLCLFLAAGPSVELVAHRGESFDAPENTLSAFQLAWDRRVPAIELDVHLTKDGQLVCIHDADTKRVAGSKLVVKESTLDQLRQLDAGCWKDPKWTGEKLPTIAEALATIPEGTRCFVEVKVGPEAIPPLVKAIEASGKKPEQLAIISFKATTIAEAKRQLPQIPAYFLSSFKQDKLTGVWSPTAEQLIQQAKSLGADGLDLGWEGPIDQEFVTKVKQAGLKFYVWTIDDPTVAKRFADWGVDGITTNRAAWLKEKL